MAPYLNTLTPVTKDSPLVAENATPRACGNSKRDRSLHLVDADNLIGDPCTTDRRQIQAAFESYRAAANFQPGDHAVVATGCNGLHVLEVELAWPDAQHRRRCGPDGADLELLEAAKFAAASGCYRRVVIGSGDHIFMVALEHLRANSIDVDVVARYGSLARPLMRQVGGRVRYMDPGAAHPRGDEPHAA